MLHVARAGANDDAADVVEPANDAAGRTLTRGRIFLYQLALALCFTTSPLLKLFLFLQMMQQNPMVQQMMQQNPQLQEQMNTLMANPAVMQQVSVIAFELGSIVLPCVRQ